jgi:Predicted transcriptional regulators
MENNKSFFNINRQAYTKIMSKNLPVLRAKNALSQTELAEMIGVTRQTISCVERGTKDLSWTHFISLLFVFTRDDSTFALLRALDIYTDELADTFKVVDLGKLKKNNEIE